MKKISTIIILIIIALAFYPCMTVSAEKGNCFGYDFMADFVTNHPDRRAGSEGEKAAANYLADYFRDSGLLPLLNNGSDNDYLLKFYADNYHSQNVVGVKKSDNSNAKQIIIGAHYDSMSTTEKNGDGTYDNGSGIGAMAQVIKEIKESSLDNDIVFIAFGGEEVGMLGSSYYVSEMSGNEKENTVLMINFDSIGCGDYLYLYTDEVENSAEDYMFKTAEDMGIAIRHIPEDRKATPFINTYSGLNYDYLMFYSDHAPFMKEKIDVAFFVGYNLEHRFLQPFESMEHSEIMHTDKDNLQNILNTYGKERVNKRIDDTARLAQSYISDKDIAQIMAASKADKFNYRWFSAHNRITVTSFIVKGVIMAVLILIMMRIISNSKKFPEIHEGTDEKPKKYIFEDLEI